MPCIKNVRLTLGVLLGDEDGEILGSVDGASDGTEVGFDDGDADGVFSL